MALNPDPTLMNPFTLCKFLCPAALAAAISSCAPAPMHITHTPVSAKPSYEAAPFSPQQSLFEWYDDGGPGAVSIKISLSNQMATFFRGGKEIGWSYVTTGREGQRTPTGSFKIQEKTIDKYSNRWGHVVDEYGEIVNSSARHTDPLPAGQKWVAAPMPYWMRITSSGIGMHAGPIPSPGTPVSAGCIRLPKQLAPKVFRAVNVGTPVTVTS